jgi:hypothetical protein
VRLAFLFLLLFFFQHAYSEALNANALKICAQHLAGEIAAPNRHYSDWKLLANELKQDLEATVLVKLDATRVSPNLLQSDLRYNGVLSPKELVHFNTANNTLFFVVHGSRENLTVLAQDLDQKFPPECLSFRILLSRPVPFPGSPEFFRAQGLSVKFAEAIEKCFFTACATNDTPEPVRVASGESPDLTILNKEARENMIEFLRAHASGPEVRRLNIASEFGLLNLMRDVTQAVTDQTIVQVQKAFLETKPKKSDGAGFRMNNPKAVDRVLAAWTVMVSHLDNSLLSDPFSPRTLFWLDQTYHAKRDDLIADYTAMRFLTRIEGPHLQLGYLQKNGMRNGFKELVSRFPDSRFRTWGLVYLDSIPFESSDYNNLRAQSRQARRRMQQGLRVLLAVARMQTNDAIDEQVIDKLTAALPKPTTP